MFYIGQWGYVYLIFVFFNCKAREFLHFKMYGKQCITPVAIMTSSAKNNHERITSLCERLGWFGRGRSSFQLFEQVLFLKLWNVFYSICFSNTLCYLSYEHYWSFKYIMWFVSLMFQLLVRKMGNGWLLNHSHLYANQVAMVWYGSLLMTKASSNGFMIMEEKVQLSVKLG